MCNYVLINTNLLQISGHGETTFSNECFNLGEYRLAMLQEELRRSVSMHGYRIGETRQQDMRPCLNTNTRQQNVLNLGQVCSAGNADVLDALIVPGGLDDGEIAVNIRVAENIKLDRHG